MAKATDAEMALSSMDLAKVRIYSDNKLYNDAVDFVAGNCRERIPKSAQAQGLLQYALSDWSDLEAFVKHQKNKLQHEDYQFYIALHSYLADLRKWVKDGSDLVSDSLNKADREARLSIVCTAIAREFIQHLTAELRYKKAIHEESPNVAR